MNAATLQTGLGGWSACSHPEVWSCKSFAWLPHLAKGGATEPDTCSFKPKFLTSCGFPASLRLDVPQVTLT